MPQLYQWIFLAGIWSMRNYIPVYCAICLVWMVFASSHTPLLSYAPLLGLTAPNHSMETDNPHKFLQHITQH